MSTELIVSGSNWVAMKEQCNALAKSGFLPTSIKTGEQALAIALKGHEVGMPIMQAFSNIHVIQGKPTISAEGMNALIRKHCPKAKLEILKNDANVCTIKATRPGEHPFTYTYTIDDAKRAGITGNPSWSKYPDAMLFARCISTIGRRVFPDCLQGISYTPEELGAEVNEDGEVVVVVEDKQKDPILYTPQEKDENGHKKLLKKIAEGFGVKDRAELAELSGVCNGTELNNLSVFIEQYLKESGFFEHQEPQVTK